MTTITVLEQTLRNLVDQLNQQEDVILDWAYQLSDDRKANKDTAPASQGRREALDKGLAICNECERTELKIARQSIVRSEDSRRDWMDDIRFRWAVRRDTCHELARKGDC